MKELKRYSEKSFITELQLTEIHTSLLQVILNREVYGVNDSLISKVVELIDEIKDCYNNIHEIPKESKKDKYVFMGIAPGNDMSMLELHRLALGTIQYAILLPNKEELEQKAYELIAEIKSFYLLEQGSLLDNEWNSYGIKETMRLRSKYVEVIVGYNQYIKNRHDKSFVEDEGENID